MDIFDKNILSFWWALQENQVQYIVIGGYAVKLHGVQHPTVDLDIWLNDTTENRKAFRNSLVDCAMGNYLMIEQMQFLPNCTEFILHNGLWLDAVTTVSGFDGQTFNHCLSSAAIADINGVNVPFLHLHQLLTNKKAMNRAKDHIVIEALEKCIKPIEES
ncbi:hypothetical protein ACFQZI_08295 [Mucilaginibacter lutimaris]|uniref:Nucleotidyltransferase family protein n=1 Tax=Mucilaginibacter lutimaris TaxID=931629 RepID=A0ABW2ZF97_9SPHI